MKKRVIRIICVLLSICTMFLSTENVLAADNTPELMENIQISINSKEFDSVPIVYNNSIYIKISDLVPWISMEAYYDVDEKKLYLDNFANSNSFNESVVMTIGDYPITMSSFNSFAKWLRYNSGISDFSITGFTNFKQFVVDQIIEAASVYYIARVNGLEMTSKNYTELKEQIALVAANFGGKEDFYSFLSNEVGISYLDYYCIQEYYYFRDMVVEKLTEESNETAYQEYYNSHITQFQKENIQVKHILFQTTDENGVMLPYAQKKEVEEQALEVLNGIQTNQYIFDKAMYLFSDDAATSTETAGFLATEDSVQPEFWAGISEAPEGVVDSLIETQYGYHIVKVMEKRQQLPYYEVRDEIEVIVKNDGFQQLLQEGIKKLDITVQDDLIERYTIY